MIDNKLRIACVCGFILQNGAKGETQSDSANFPAKELVPPIRQYEPFINGSLPLMNGSYWRMGGTRAQITNLIKRNRILVFSANAIAVDLPFRVSQSPSTLLKQ
jgi:hypothetical protein